MKKIVVIAAAGRGNRLGAGMPKCLVKVNDHMVFEYLLKAFEWADEIRMVVGYKADEVIKTVTEINSKVKFIRNEEFSNTTTLQSNFIGAENIAEKALFIDGDMIISKQTAEYLCSEYEKGNNFIGVATDISEEPVYAGVNKENVEWFSYDRKSDYEWANVALIDVAKLEYLHTHFFVQLEKFLPMKAIKIERLEIDTPTDLKYTQKIVDKLPEKYNYWR